MMQASMTSYAELQAMHELDVYGKRGITLVRGTGATVWDDRDRAYIDCVAGHGAAALGHGHARVIQAIEEQARRLMACPGAFSNDTRARYLEALCSAAPMKGARAFLCNSGAEAVEGALKFARMSTGRTAFIAAEGGFHGRTFGAMSATSKAEYAKGSEPLVPGFTHIPYNDQAALRAAMAQQPAGVILEVVQGEGGVIPGDPAFFQEARRLCDDSGALLIIDEVQTGFCRTGRMFALEHFGLRPDIVCVAKAMASGFPMGAVLVGEQIEVPVGRHGSTFGGNPLACAAALATLRVLQEENLAAEAVRKGSYLVKRLQQEALRRVREIRYLGLMIGIELRCRVKPVLNALMEEGVLALPAGSAVLRLLPPLVISFREVDCVAEAIIRVLEGKDPLPAPRQASR